MENVKWGKIKKLIFFRRVHKNCIYGINNRFAALYMRYFKFKSN